jgi:hypothetical protein
MSKKLIAVASAAALALTALVGIAPANAVSATVAITGTAGTSPGTSANPVTQTVPFENTLASDGSAAIAFSSIASGDKITITTSGKVRIASAETVGTADINVTTLGSQNFTAEATSTSFNAYAFTTDEVTTEIKWTVTRPSTGGSSSGSLWIKGVDAGTAEAHTVETIAVPTVLAKGASSEVRVLIKDVFGNPIEATVSAATVTGAANSVNLVWDAVNKWHDATITSATDRSFVITIDGNGTGTADDTVDTAGLPANKLSTVVVVNAAGSVAAPAQITALTAQVAALVADYNKLAKRWNKLVDSKKAPKKKRALK